MTDKGEQPVGPSVEELDAYRLDAACENPARYLTRDQARTEMASAADSCLELLNEDYAIAQEEAEERRG